MKKWLLPKIVAGLALLWILIWILWTAILYILSPKQVQNTDNNSKEIKLSPEQLNQLRQIAWTWAETTWTWTEQSWTGK